MMSKLTCAAIACWALGVSAGSPSDMTELVQSNLKVHAPPELAVNLAREQRSNKYHLDHKALAAFFSTPRLSHSAIGFIMRDGRRWSKMLWGNATEGVSGQPVTAPETSGCSAGDRETAATRVQKLQDDFVKTLEEALPKMMAEAQSAAFGGGGEMSIDINDVASQLPGGLAASVPKACQNVINGVGTLEWASLMSCVKEVFPVSTDCINCFPQFGKQVQDGCGLTCASALNEASAGFDNATSALDAQGKKSKMSEMGMSQEDMMAITQIMTDVVNNGLKKLAPCGECVTPKATSFARCVGGEEAAKFVQERADELTEALKSGDLLRVEAGGPDMGMGSDEKMVM